MISNIAFDLDRGRSNSATMEKLSILYLGTDSGTSRHRARSLIRLRHKVKVLDPYSFLPAGWMMNYWNHHTGALGSGTLVRTRVLEAIQKLKFNLVWVDGGDVICPELVFALKRQARFVINYNLDDPYVERRELQKMAAVSAFCSSLRFDCGGSRLQSRRSLSGGGENCTASLTGDRTRLRMRREKFPQRTWRSGDPR